MSTKNLNTMSKDEINLLLYLESRAHDYGGLVAVVQGPMKSPIMNNIDMDIAKGWNDEGFILFGRISSESLKTIKGGTHWCELSEEAWELAHKARREKYEKNKQYRTWQKTSEV